MNLGIPKDQFRAEVDSIAVTLNGVPQKFLIHDENEGKIITPEYPEYAELYVYLQGYSLEQRG